MTTKVKNLLFYIKARVSSADHLMPVLYIQMVIHFVTHAYLKRRGKQGRTIRVLMVPLGLTSSALKELFRSLRSKGDT